MARFDNEGFNPKKRIDNDSRDRSVPEDEKYYSNNSFDIFSNGDVVDNQNASDINDLINSFNNPIEPPQRSSRQNDYNFTPEVQRDYDKEQRARNRQNANIQKNNQGRQKPPKNKKPVFGNISLGKKIKLSIISVILVIVLLIAGLANTALNRINYDDKIDNKYVSSQNLESSSRVKNILLLGVDARNPDDATKSRADTMMLVSIDSKHNCIKMVSFLRDTWVYIPAHDGEQRLNAACTYGGYSGVCDTIEYNFGVKIDGYVVADFEMFKILVDSIGGVEVDVTKKEAKEVTNHKKRYGNVKLESGKHILTGEQALAYCRIRKIDTDFVRTKRQRTVMQSILKGVKGSNIFTLYKMIYNSAPYIETNLSKTQLLGIGTKALTCLKNEMVQTKVPFEHTWEYANKRGASVIAINVDKNKEQLKSFLYEKSAEEIIAEQNADK